MCFFFSKSELLYPEGTISPSGGIAADILCKGRDYLVSSGIFVWLWDFLPQDKIVFFYCITIPFKWYLWREWAQLEAIIFNCKNCTTFRNCLQSWTRKRRRYILREFLLAFGWTLLPLTRASCNRQLCLKRGRKTKPKHDSLLQS